MSRLREHDATSELMAFVYPALGGKGDLFPKRAPKVTDMGGESHAPAMIDVLKPALIASGWTPPTHP